MAVNPILFLPLHARLGERAFWPLMLLIALPAAGLLLHLDRAADRPDRLRGLSAPVEAEVGTARLAEIEGGAPAPSAAASSARAVEPS